MAKTQEELGEELSAISTELMNLATVDTIIPITTLLLRMVQWGADCVETGSQLTADGIKELMEKKLAEQKAQDN